MQWFNKTLLAGCLAGALLGAQGCATVQGVGEDIETAGESLESAAEQTTPDDY